MTYILVPESSIAGRKEFEHHRRLADGRVICPPKDILLLAGVAGIEVVDESDVLALIAAENAVTTEASEEEAAEEDNVEQSNE